MLCFCYDIGLLMRSKNKIACWSCGQREICTSIWFVCPNMGNRRNVHTSLNVLHFWLRTNSWRWMHVTHIKTDCNKKPNEYKHSKQRFVCAITLPRVFIYLGFCMMLELNCLNFLRLAIGCLVRVFNFIDKYCKRGNIAALTTPTNKKCVYKAFWWMKTIKLHFNFLQGV